MLEIAALAFEFAGEVELRQCASGQDAVDVLKGEGFDVVLLDVMMNGMDGPSTLRELRQTKYGAELPAIFMTGRAREAEIQELLGEGAVGVITKPFDPVTLVDEIKSILASPAN